MHKRLLHTYMKAALYLIAVLFLISFCRMGTLAQATPSEPQQRLAGKDTDLSQPVRPLTANIRAYGIELAELEQAYDATLYQVLSYFFESGTFLLDVRVEAVARTTDIRTTSPEEAVRIITNLPGLPHFEEDTTIPGSSVTTISQFFTGMELKRLHITIYADTSYDEDELEFMKQLTMAAAKVEAVRGDQVHIISQSFPREMIQLGWKVTAAKKTEDADPKGVDTEADVAEDTPARETTGVKLKRPVTELPGLILAISSALLIFVIIFITITLRKKYA